MESNKNLNCINRDESREQVLPPAAVAMATITFKIDNNNNWITVPYAVISSYVLYLVNPQFFYAHFPQIPKTHVVIITNIPTNTKDSRRNYN